MCYREGGRVYRASAANLSPLGPDDEGNEPAELPLSAHASADPAAVVAYTDGACSGNPGPAGLGVVLMWDDQVREVSEYLGKGTNNIAELTAILRAAQEIKKLDRPGVIYTDSSYSLGVLTKNWKAKANQTLVARTRRALAELKSVQIIKVAGHAGVPENERADRLAVEAVKNNSSQ
jgi:ribonuclease HI